MTQPATDNESLRKQIARLIKSESYARQVFFPSDHRTDDELADHIMQLIEAYIAKREETGLITQLVTTNFSHWSLLKGSGEYPPDDFGIYKSRYKDGSLKITIRLAPYLEKELFQNQKAE